MEDSINHYSRRAIVILAVLACIYTLQVARDVLLPITLAVIFALLFSPLVNRLATHGVPRALSALIIIASSLTFFGAGIYLLSEPAAQWLLRAPEAAEAMEQHIESLKKDVATVDEATRSLESITESIPAQSSQTQEVVVAEPGWRAEMWLAIRNFISYGALSIILIFFLLTSGQKLLERFIQTLPSKRDRQQTLRIATSAQTQMSRYLATITAVNITVGAITALGLWLIDFPDPLLWGTVAAVLRYVPYLGVTLTVGIMAIIGSITYASPWLVLAAPLGYLSLASIFGQVVDPFVHGYRFSLNPIIVFLWIFFWGWLWGAPGVLLAVPLLTLFQVICEQTPGLQPIAMIISDRDQNSAHDR